MRPLLPLILAALAAQCASALTDDQQQQQQQQRQQQQKPEADEGDKVGERPHFARQLSYLDPSLDERLGRLGRRQSSAEAPQDSSASLTSPLDDATTSSATRGRQLAAGGYNYGAYKYATGQTAAGYGAAPGNYKPAAGPSRNYAPGRPASNYAPAYTAPNSYGSGAYRGRPQTSYGGAIARRPGGQYGGASGASYAPYQATRPAYLNRPGAPYAAPSALYRARLAELREVLELAEPSVKVVPPSRAKPAASNQHHAPKTIVSFQLVRKVQAPVDAARVVQPKFYIQEAPKGVPKPKGPANSAKTTLKPSLKATTEWPHESESEAEAEGGSEEAKEGEAAGRESSGSEEGQRGKEEEEEAPGGEGRDEEAREQDQEQHEEQQQQQRQSNPAEGQQQPEEQAEESRGEEDAHTVTAGRNSTGGESSDGARESEGESDKDQPEKLDNLAPVEGKEAPGKKEIGLEVKSLDGAAAKATEAAEDLVEESAGDGGSSKDKQSSSGGSSSSSSEQQSQPSKQLPSELELGGELASGALEANLGAGAVKGELSEDGGLAVGLTGRSSRPIIAGNEANWPLTSAKVAARKLRASAARSAGYMAG